MNNLYVIDGKNVCHWIAQLTKIDRDLSIQPLLSVISALQQNGDDFICIFDANTVHDLRDSGRSGHAQIISDLIAKFPDRFRTVASGTKADSLILAEADDRNCDVISGDRYRQYQEKYEWLRHAHPPRILGANLNERAVIFDDKLTLLPVPLLHDMAKASAEIGRMNPLTPPGWMPVSKDVSVIEARHENYGADEDLELDRTESRASIRQKKSEASFDPTEQAMNGLFKALWTTGKIVWPILIAAGAIISLIPPKDRN